MNILKRLKFAYSRKSQMHMLMSSNQLINNLKFRETAKSPKRTEVINFCASQRNFENYLEIGVRNPADNFDKIQVPNKTSVDPGIEFVANPVTHKMTSDAFYELWSKNKMAHYDLIFIDGLHLAEQVARDISNAIDMTTENGVIVLHDCNPPHQIFAREDFTLDGPAGGAWNGTTYKAAWEYAFIGAYETRIIDCDWGVGVIDKSKPKSPTENPNRYFEWNKFETIRATSGLLINPTEFEAWLLSTNP